MEAQGTQVNISGKELEKQKNYIPPKLQSTDYPVCRIKEADKFEGQPD